MDIKYIIQSREGSRGGKERVSEKRDRDTSRVYCTIYGYYTRVFVCIERLHIFYRRAESRSTCIHESIILYI